MWTTEICVVHYRYNSNTSKQKHVYLQWFLIIENETNGWICERKETRSRQDREDHESARESGENGGLCAITNDQTNQSILSHHVVQVSGSGVNRLIYDGDVEHIRPYGKRKTRYLLLFRLLFTLSQHHAIITHHNTKRHQHCIVCNHWMNSNILVVTTPTKKESHKINKTEVLTSLVLRDLPPDPGNARYDLLIKV